MNIKRLIKHKFFKGSFIVLISAAVNSIFNYLYHLFVVRNVSVSQYGTLQSLISLNYIFTIITGAFSLSLISELGDKSSKEISLYTAYLVKIALKGSLLIWLILLVFYPLIKDFLHLKSFTPFFIFTFQHGIIFLPVVYQSILKAKLKFWQSSLASVLATGFKILTISLLFHFGLKLNGALLGLVSFKMVLFLVSGFFVYQLLAPFDEHKEKSTLNISFWKFSFITLLTNFALTAIFTFDILLVKHLFDNNLAGVYGATSTVGKIIFFIAGAILIVAYPLFVKYKQDDDKLKTLLILSLLSSLVVITVGLFIYKFFGKLIIINLLTTKYLEVLPYLFPFGIFISLASIFNLIIRFFLAIESKFSLFLSLPIAVGQIVLISFRHQSLFEVINNSIIMLSVGVGLGILFIFKHFINESKTTRN